MDSADLFGPMEYGLVQFVLTDSKSSADRARLSFVLSTDFSYVN